MIQACPVGIVTEAPFATVSGETERALLLVSIVYVVLTVFEYKEIVPFATVAGVNAVLVALVTWPDALIVITGTALAPP
jgi:hypothetical protein